MTDVDDIPEPDRLDGAPHPRDARCLIGQEPAERNFLDAYNAHRLHHAWLITGPRGVGKATLAWRIARFLLANPPAEEDGLFGAPPPPATLDIDPEHPVARRMRSLSEPGLFLLRRAWVEKTKRLRNEITVDEARKLKRFFSLSATDGGRRVVLVDAADEMNPSAANAVLKLLEEPPQKAVLLLVSHQPLRLLPTIRSRCRTLRCRTLAPEEMQRALAAIGEELPADAGSLTALADGSVGAAHEILHGEGLAVYQALVRLFTEAPQMDREMALALADGRARSADQAFRMIDLFLTRLARTGALGPPTPEAAPGEAALLTRLCPNVHAARHWAALQQAASERARHGLAVNLDPAGLLLDTVLRINTGAGEVLHAPT